MDQWNENRRPRWNGPNQRFQRPPRFRQQMGNEDNCAPPYRGEQGHPQFQPRYEPPNSQQLSQSPYQGPSPPVQFPPPQYNPGTQYNPTQHYFPPNQQPYQQQQYTNNNLNNVPARNYPPPTPPPNQNQQGQPPNMNWPVLPQSNFNDNTSSPDLQTQLFGPDMTNPPPQQNRSHPLPERTGHHDVGQQSVYDTNFALGSNNQTLQCITPVKSEDDADKEWVTSWLRKLDKRMVVPQKSIVHTLTVPEAKSLMHEALLLLRDLSQLHTQLVKDCQTADETTWSLKCRKVSVSKARLQEIQSQLIPKEKELAKKLTRIRKKRERIKKRNAALCEEKEISMQKREELHQQLDLWQNQIHQEDLRTRREKLLKQEADNILAEVRKKQAESTKALDLIYSLLKLRSLRKDAVQRKGLHTTQESDQTFSSKLATLEAILVKQLEDYEGEEKALKVMLESTREAEQREKNENFLIKVADARKVLAECLFGCIDAPSTDDPIFPFWKFYTQAEESLDSLLNIREEWDSYIVPPDASFGSSVPVHWVVPEEPTSVSWKSVAIFE